MPPVFRPSNDADRKFLNRRGFPAVGDASVFVVENGGAVGGAFAAIPRPFESEWLGLDVLHVVGIEAWDEAISLDDLARRSVAGLAEAGVQLVTCRRDESDRREVGVLQGVGLHVIECLLTLGCPLADPPDAPGSIDIAGPDDADQVARVAERSFKSDRFHSDLNIDDARADALKGQWARNSVAGRADKVFVSRHDGQVTGFNACLLTDGGAVIDLIGVDPDFQGRGLGRSLTAAALDHYASIADRMTVGTQSNNFGSLALYQSMGFRVEKSALTLHGHLS